MKNLLFFSAILFTCQASAQSYIPLHLDTSCFWVLDYKQYDAYWVASGEHTAYVAGETTFNGKNYFVIDAYPSAAPYVSSLIYLNQYMNGNTNYLREDTAAKKIYSADGKLYLSQTLHEESNTIPLYDLPTGIYIIRLRDNDRYITGKMLVE